MNQLEITGKMLHQAERLTDIAKQYEEWESISDEKRLHYSLMAVYLNRMLQTNTQKIQALVEIEKKLLQLLDPSSQDGKMGREE